MPKIIFRPEPSPPPFVPPTPPPATASINMNPYPFSIDENVEVSINGLNITTEYNELILWFGYSEEDYEVFGQAFELDSDNGAHFVMRSVNFNSEDYPFICVSVEFDGEILQVIPLQLI